MENEFFLVIQNGTPIYDHDGDVLIQRYEDGTQFYVSPECVNVNLQTEYTDRQTDNIINQNNQDEMQFCVSPGAENVHETKQNDTTNRQWTTNEIKALICLYKKYKHMFASSTVKNIKVWQKIAEELGTHSATQCENKFKYLKSKYLNKKDNMNHRSSGARAIHFEYFDEMDEIFCKEPIVKPISIASSSRQNNVEEQEEQDSDINPANENILGKRTRKNIKLKETIAELNEILKKSEEEKNKRHADFVELQKYSINKFSELMSKILDKM